MLHEPSQQPRIVFALDAEVECRSASGVLIVHVGAVCREELRGREMPQVPSSEKGRHPHYHIDACSRADERREVLDVIPPCGRERASAGSICHARAPLDQELHELRVARACHRFEEWSASVFAPRLIDREAEAEQMFDDPDLRGRPDAATPRLRHTCNVKQRAPLSVAGGGKTRRFAKEPLERGEIQRRDQRKDRPRGPVLQAVPYLVCHQEAGTSSGGSDRSGLHLDADDVQGAPAHVLERVGRERRAPERRVHARGHAHPGVHQHGAGVVPANEVTPREHVVDGGPLVRVDRSALTGTDARVEHSNMSVLEQDAVMVRRGNKRVEFRWIRVELVMCTSRIPSERVPRHERGSAAARSVQAGRLLPELTVVIGLIKVAFGLRDQIISAERPFFIATDANCPAGSSGPRVRSGERPAVYRVRALKLTESIATTMSGNRED